jgi:quercetin dioxygenase-like cupin family protein
MSTLRRYLGVRSELKRASRKAVFKNLEDMIEFAKDGIVSKTVVKVEGNEISLFCMSAGQQLSTHSASFPAVIHVLRGKGEITLDKEVYDAKPNSWFSMPKDLPHSVKATENFVFLLTLLKGKSGS